MKSPRLPYYFHLPIILLMLVVVLPAAWTVWVGIGSWDLQRTVNWGGKLSPWSLTLLRVSITSLPVLVAGIYFLRRFFRRQDVHLVYSVVIVAAAILGSFALMPLLY